MTSLLERPRSRTKSGGALVVGLPQVNLLPPEVRAARALRHVKQWLAVVLLLVVALAGVTYALAVLARGAADAELTGAQAEATQLQAQEQKYGEVQPVLNGLKRTSTARADGMAPEVVWKPYLDAIAAVLPPSVSISSFSVVQGTLLVPAPVPADALTEPGVATVQFTVRATTLPDSAAWTDALNSVPGFYGAMSSSDALSDVEGVIAYDVTTIVQVSSAALANRFPADAPTEGS